MAATQSVEHLQRELKKTVVDYIETEYFGKSPELRERCDDELRSTTLLFQNPYFEATPAYSTVSNGVSNSLIPPTAKQYLEELTQEGKVSFRIRTSIKSRPSNHFGAARMSWFLRAPDPAKPNVSCGP